MTNARHDGDRVAPSQGDAETACRRRLPSYGATEDQARQGSAHADEEDDRVEAWNGLQSGARRDMVVECIDGEGQNEKRRAGQAFGDVHGRHLWLY